MQRALITGSSGMLGADLSRELGEGYEVSGADLITRSTGHQVTRFIECDITDRKRTADVIAQIRPGVIIHTAAMTDVDGCEREKDKAYRINSEGALNVALACKESAAAMLYISTDFIFDGKKKAPYVESDKPNPLSVYGDSKLKGEEAIMKNLKEYYILRTSWLYGANGKNFVDTIIAKAKTEKALEVVDDQVGSPTFTVDLAKAIHALLNKIFTKDERRTANYGIYHVSNSGSASWYEYAKEILRLTGAGTKVIPISSEELNRPATRPAMSILDNSKFNGFTNYRMRNWKDALKEYISERKEK